MIAVGEVNETPFTSVGSQSHTFTRAFRVFDVNGLIHILFYAITISDNGR